MMAEDLYRFVREDMRSGPSLELLLELANKPEGWQPILGDSRDNIIGFSADLTKYITQSLVNSSTIIVAKLDLNYSLEVYKPGEEYRICLKDSQGVVAEHYSHAVEDLYTRINDEFQRKLDSDFSARATKAKNLMEILLGKVPKRGAGSDG